MREFLRQLFEWIVILALILGAFWFFGGITPREVPGKIMSVFSSTKEVVTEGAQDVSHSSQGIIGREERQLERFSEKIK